MDETSFPPSKYSEDMVQLQTIFPVEIWQKLFHNIGDVETYWRICSASIYFYKILLPLRTHILFPAVIKHLTGFIFCTKTAYPVLLKCRQVCRDWKQEVDNAFQDILNQNASDASRLVYAGQAPISIFNRNFVKLFQSFLAEENIDRFFAKFYNSHFLTEANPFPSRSLEIAIRSSVETFGGCHNKLIEVLCAFGHHIWHCCVTLSYTNSEMEQLVPIFCSVLKLLPELKSLRILHFCNILNEEADILENILLANAIPKFKKLEILEERELAGPIFSQLIQKNSHVTKLIIHGLESERHSELFTKPLHNLEELHIMYYKSAYDLINLQNASVTWSLKKLTIISHPDPPNVRSMFNCIETQWAKTLTHLDIEIPSSALLIKRHFLRLPYLQNLKIRLDRYVSMDLILPMSKSLVTLCVCIVERNQYYETLENNSTIKFFFHRGDLIKSNIWKHFPRLKYLKYSEKNMSEHCVRHYRRNQLEG